MGLRRLLDKDFLCVMDACLQMQHGDQEGAAHMHKLEAVGSGSPARSLSLRELRAASHTFSGSCLSISSSCLGL